MSNKNVEIVRAILGREGEARSWDEAEIDQALRDYCDPELVWDPIEAPAPYRGYAEAKASLTEWFEAVENFEVELEEIVEEGDRVLAVTRHRATGKGSGARVEQTVYQLFEFRQERILSFREFADRNAAEAAMRAGV